MTQLQHWRLVRGLSQDQLATLAGCSKSAISQYEHGINKPRFPVCDRLAHVLGIDRNVLIQDFYGFSITDDPASCMAIAAPNADSN